MHAERIIFVILWECKYEGPQFVVHKANYSVYLFHLHVEHE